MLIWNLKLAPVGILEDRDVGRMLASEAKLGAGEEERRNMHVSVWSRLVSHT